MNEPKFTPGPRGISESGEYRHKDCKYFYYRPFPHYPYGYCTKWRAADKCKSDDVTQGNYYINNQCPFFELRKDQASAQKRADHEQKN